METADDTLDPATAAAGNTTPRMMRSRRNSNQTASEMTDDEDALSDHGNWLANEVEPGMYALRVSRIVLTLHIRCRCFEGMTIPHEVRKVDIPY